MFTPPAGKLFVISAPTGAGKTTVARAVLQRLAPDGITRVTTYTTRKPRQNEKAGSDYIFLTEQEFLRKKECGFFLETTTYDNSWYGSPASIRNDIQQGKSFIMITDRPGAQTIKRLIPQAILLWITVPSPQTIIQRLQQRGTEDRQHIQRRVDIAAQEMTQEKEQPFFDYHVMNDQLEKTIEKIAAIIKQELAK